MPKDAADLHVERWRDHPFDIAFDDDVEAMTVRVAHLQRYFKTTKRRALAELNIADFEYDTLHCLMIRETPGHASPTDLASDLRVSGAGITGRLDGLEKKGWVKRVPRSDDRRKVDVEITKAGAAIARKAMRKRGDAEDAVAGAISERELATLNRILRKMNLFVEASDRRASATSATPSSSTAPAARA